MQTQEQRKTNITRVVCGVATGLANGVFGGGGGMLAVPLLKKTGYQEKQAHATAILVILPVSIFSFWVYFLQGFYDFSVLIPTAIGVTAGGLLGAYFLDKLPIKITRWIFAFLQVVAGGYMLFFS